MIVLIADAFEQSGIDALGAAGCEVHVRPELKDESLVTAIRDTQADVLVVRSTRVTEPMLDAGRVSLVVRAGAGYNTIAVAAASKRGIYVANCPGKNAVAVAELTLGLVLALDRRIPDNVIELRAGRWNKKEFSKARGLAGRRLGVLGLGSIACEVIRRAAAFEMPVVAWSRRFDGVDRALTAGESERLGLEGSVTVGLAPSPADVAARCDVLTVHLALSSETRGLVDASVLSRLAPGSYVVNTSRGEIVDHVALAEAVRSKALRVALDVFAVEPAASTGEFADELIALPGVYGTHHIGASTDQAQHAIARETVHIITTYLTTGRVPNVVNLAVRTPASHRLIVRHRDRPGVLAHVFDRIRAAEINVQETENIVFEGAEAAVARINLDGRPEADALEEIRRGHPDILDLHLVAL